MLVKTSCIWKLFFLSGPEKVSEKLVQNTGENKGEAAIILHTVRVQLIDVHGM